MDTRQRRFLRVAPWSQAVARRLGDCGRCEGVQGVLTLVFREVAQAFHDDRVVELSGQLEEEEQDGKRTEDNHKHSKDHGYGDEMKWKTQDT